VHSASGYFTVYGSAEPVNRDHFNVHLATGDTRTPYCRTGYLGFVRRTDMTQSDGGTVGCLVIFVGRPSVCSYLVITDNRIFIYPDALLVDFCVKISYTQNRQWQDGASLRQPAAANFELSRTSHRSVNNNISVSEQKLWSAFCRES